jgi:uncharacterized membrane protein
MRDPLLVVHIAAGTLALLLGPIAMLAPKRRGRHTRVGSIYHWTMLAVCVSAAGLALIDFSRIGWFLPIAVFSYANAFVGYNAARRRYHGWLAHHIAGMGGSYIALTTALLVVNFGSAGLVVWFAPTIVGSPLIAWATARVARGPLGGAVRRAPRAA